MGSDFPLKVSQECDEHIFIAGGVRITAFLASSKVLKSQGQAFDVALGKILETLSDKVELCISETGSRLDIATILGRAGEKTHVYVYGPEILLDAVKQTAKTIGLPENKISTEAFAVSTSGDPFMVEIESQGKELQVKEEESLLDILRGAGFDVASRCEVGNCGTCHIGVRKGRVEHRGTGLLEEEKKGMMLSCVSRGVGTLVLDL
jgi:ferredoxin-NADP reductase